MLRDAASATFFAHFFLPLVLPRPAVYTISTPVPCNPWACRNCVQSMGFNCEMMGAAGHLPRLVLRPTLPTVALCVCVCTCVCTVAVCVCVHAFVHGCLCFCQRTTSHNLRVLPVSQAF